MEKLVIQSLKIAERIRKNLEESAEIVKISKI